MEMLGLFAQSSGDLRRFLKAGFEPQIYADQNEKAVEIVRSLCCVCDPIFLFQFF